MNINSDKLACTNSTTTIVETLLDLGYIINLKKSVLIPTQRITVFGFLIDSIAFMVFLTDEKVVKIITKAKLMVKATKVTARELASFIGLIISAFDAILEAPLHYKALERNKLNSLGSDGDFDNGVILSDRSVSELHWWQENVDHKNGKHIRVKDVDYRCRTDASFAGWGAISLETELCAREDGACMRSMKT